MKILIDARFLGTPTGIGRYVEELVRELENLIEAKHRSSFVEAKLLPQARHEASLQFVVLVSKDGWEKWEPVIKPEAQYYRGRTSFPRSAAECVEVRPQNALRAQIRKRLVDAHWYTVAEQFALWRVLREEKPDLVHFPHWNISYFWRGPFIVTIHDLILLEYPTRRASALGAISYLMKYKLFFPLVLRKAIFKSKKIIVPSNYTKQSILKHFPKVDEGKIEVIYEGVKIIEAEPPSFVRQGGLQSASRFGLNSNYLLYVGNALPHKNLEFLIRVFKKLKELFVNSDHSDGLGFLESRLKLVLVGEPSYFYDRLKKYVGAQGLKFVEAKPPLSEVSLRSNDVIFTGRVSDEELADLYKNASAYVFPSLLEGFGLPPLEAMAQGTPVAASNTSSLPEILNDAALYFDPRNEDEAASKIKEILVNQSLCQDLILKGHNQVKKYSWGKAADMIYYIYASWEERAKFS